MSIEIVIPVSNRNVLWSSTVWNPNCHSPKWNCQKLFLAFAICNSGRLSLSLSQNWFTWTVNFSKKSNDFSLQWKERKQIIKSQRLDTTCNGDLPGNEVKWIKGKRSEYVCGCGVLCVHDARVTKRGLKNWKSGFSSSKLAWIALLL